MAQGQTVINGNRVITGVWDAGAAISTKPAKSGTVLPAACSAGEQFFKTDAAAGKNLYLCASADTWTRTAQTASVKSLTVFDPAIGDSGRVQLMFDEPVTITRVACSVKGGTSTTIQLDERPASAPDSSGIAVMTAALVCDANQKSTTAFANAAIAARVPVALLISAVSGTPDTLRVFISYTVD
jgi:hypothetical protein